MPVPFKKLFEYPALERQEVNGKRLYLCDGQPLPSVTTILQKTKCMDGINAWRLHVGEKKADQILKESVAVGSLLHLYLEKYLLGTLTNENTKTNMIHKSVRRMADKMIEMGLSKLESFQGTEIPLYYEGLWAGTCDLLATINGELAIFDFKNSNKIKKLEHIEDYFCQGVAYALSHNKMFGTNIRKVVILMVTRPRPEHPNDEIEFKDFVLEGKEFDEFCDKWIERVENYYALEA